MGNASRVRKNWLKKGVAAALGFFCLSINRRVFGSELLCNRFSDDVDVIGHISPKSSTTVPSTLPFLSLEWSSTSKPSLGSASKPLGLVVEVWSTFHRRALTRALGLSVQSSASLLVVTGREVFVLAPPGDLVLREGRRR